MTQWGDATEEKPLPDGLNDTDDLRFMTNRAGLDFTLRDDSNTKTWDNYANLTGFQKGWPLGASIGTMLFTGPAENAPNPLLTWPIHCYGYVGVGRGYAPDTGSGAELYTIIGQPQRHMDRNLAVVGRIIEGMEHLSSLPRGHGELGFYTDEEAHLRTSINSVRLGNEIADLPRFEYLDTASQSFARYVEVRANRNDAFYTVPAGGVDVCSVQVPIRRARGE